MSARKPTSNVDRATIEFLVQHAVRAVSGDNSQPWNFIWNGRALRIEGDPARGGFCLDTIHESLLIALGAAFENIRIAASTRGLAPTWRLVGESSVEIELQNCGAVRDALFDAIESRCVNRRFYDRRPLDGKAKLALTSIQMPPGLEVKMIGPGPQYQLLSELVSDADGYVFTEKPMWDVLMRWVRSGSSTDGMPISTLGLNFFERSAFPILRNWKLVSFLDHFGLARTFRARSRRLMNSSSAACCIVTDEWTPLNLFSAGMMFQRLWLQAQLLGVAVQPMSAAVFVASKFRSNGLDEYSDRLRVSAARIESGFQSLFGDRKPVVLVRLGYAEPPAARTARRPLDEVLRFTEGAEA